MNVRIFSFLVGTYIGQERFTPERKHEAINKSQIVFDTGLTMQTKTGHLHVSIQAGKGPSCLATQIFLLRLWFGTVVTKPKVHKTHLSKKLQINEPGLKVFILIENYQYKECILLIH